jgi:WD40 repeat protein
MRSKLRTSVLVLAMVALVLPLGGAARALPDLPTACPESDPGYAVSRCANWVARYDDGFSYDQAFGVVTSADGQTVFVTGNGYDHGRMTTIAYDAATGAEKWKSFFSRSGTQVRSIAIAPNGQTVFITGFSSDGGSFSKFATVAYDAASGAEKWVAISQGPWGHGDYSTEIVVSPDSQKVYVAGTSFHVNPDGSDDRSDDYRIVAYSSSTGAQVWASTFDSIGVVGNHSDRPEALAVSPNGQHLAVTGRWANTAGSGYHFGTMSLNASTGAKEWIGEYTGGAQTYDLANDVSFSPDSSRVFVTGDSYGGLGYQRATVAYSVATGQQLWAVRFVGPGHNSDFGKAVTVSPDGQRVYVTGESVASAPIADYSTQALDASTGAQIWEARYSVPRGSRSEDMVLSPDGSRLYVTGASWTYMGWNIATVAYDTSLGLEQWVARYTANQVGIGDQDDWDPFISIAPDGSRVFVNGTSAGNGTSKDLVTLSYNR